MIVRRLFGSFFSDEKNRQNITPENQKTLAKKAEHFPFDFDRWYANLHEYSFPSILLSIKPATARAMVHFYQHYYQHRNVLTREDVAELRHLHDEIQAKMNKMLRGGQSQGGVFVRMSNRSPKDGIPLFIDGKSVNDVYQSIIADDANTDLNEKMTKLCSAQMKFLFCQNSDQVMNLLLTSERVYADLNLALDCHDIKSNDEWSTSVVLREWQSDLREEFEFRVFVHEGRVTAVSQYNPYCTFPELTALLNDPRQTQELLDKISAYVNDVHRLVKHDSYIIDIAVFRDKIQIVELNPFAQSTGPCLFSWRKDEQILLGKTGKPEIRVRSAPVENLKAIIDNMVANEEAAAAEKREPYNIVLDNVSRQFNKTR